MEDHLFDIVKDYGQTEEITDPGIIRMMEDKMSRAMKENEAPKEQWGRMGL